MAASHVCRILTSRLAPVLGRADPGQLTVVRHGCRTMVANLLASGNQPRPEGLTSVPDEDGRLYAAALSGIRSAPVRPPVDTCWQIFEA